MKRVNSCLSALLLTLGLVSHTSTVRAQEAVAWRLYDFSETKLMRFEVSVVGAEDKREGSCTLGFETREDGQLTMSFKGSLGNQGAEFKASAPPDELYSVTLLKMMMTPPGAPLAATIFAPYWQMFFADASLDPGSEWTFGEGVDQLLFTVEAGCAHAGLEGARVVWHEAGQPRAEACINSDVPLPLAFSYRTGEGVQYDIRMTEYEPRR